MSNSSSKVYSFQMAKLAAGALASTPLGTAANPPVGTVPNPFYPHSSRIIKVVNTAPGGTASKSIRIAPIASAANDVQLVAVSGDNNADTSQYTVYWVNEYQQDSLLF